MPTMYAMLKEMCEKGYQVKFWVIGPIDVYSGLIDHVGDDYVAVTDKKGYYNAIIPIDKLLMAEIVKTPGEDG